ncbi:MAG: hypothetical protein QOD10_3851, partial [Mycobacterium sp.]|nr:hypothetical protein [Mycobacterium sp.]
RRRRRRGAVLPAAGGKGRDDGSEGAYRYVRLHAGYASAAMTSGPVVQRFRPGYRFVIIFVLVRRARSRGSVEERPLHTRKVAGSIPAGTTGISAGSGLRCIIRHNPWAGLRPFHAANMRPSCRLAARRKIAHHVATKNFLRPFFKRAPVQATTARGCAPTTSQQARTRVVRPLPNFGQIEGLALSIADPPGQSRRRRDLPRLEVA